MAVLEKDFSDRAQLKALVKSTYRHDYVHAIGTPILLIEPIFASGRLIGWIAEIRVDDLAYVGNAWYDYVELLLEEINFNPNP